MRKGLITVVWLCVVMAVWVPTGRADTIFQSVGIASSPNPVGSGARALGMGGAFIAVADDATAASWNPAGLVQLEGPEFSFVGAYVDRNEDFSSAAQPEIETSGITRDASLNFLSFTYPLVVFNRNLVVSVNYQQLYDFGREFTYDRNLGGAVVGRETVAFDQDGYLGAMGLAAAYELTPRLSVGVTFNYWRNMFGARNGWDSSVRTRSVITAIESPVFGTISLDPPDRLDVSVRDEFDNFSGVNWNFGLLWDINSHISIGAVVKTDFWGDVDHTFTQTTKDASGNIISSVSSRENASLRLPLSYGAGISCRFTDQFTMDLDAYRTQWKKYTFEDEQGNRFSPIEGLPEALSDVDDTTQVRLGAEYLFLLPEKYMVIPVRAGVFYDPEPREGSPQEFYGISLGSGIGFKRIIVDIAYQFRWGRHVDGDKLITTGDTEVDVRHHSLLASLIVHF
jgi:long-subunit fatty acid transport protein